MKNNSNLNEEISYGANRRGLVRVLRLEQSDFPTAESDSGYSRGVCIGVSAPAMRYSEEQGVIPREAVRSKQRPELDLPLRCL